MSKLTYAHGTTNTAAALRYARDNMFLSTNGGRNNIKDVIVIITDGGSNDFAATLREARDTRIRGIHVLVVAVTKWVNMVEINEIASDPDKNNVFSVGDFSQLADISSRLKKAICNGRAIHFCFPVICQLL